MTLRDTQSEPDDRNIAIDRVGVKGLRYPIQIRDKHRSTQSTIATAQLTVDLPHHHKGTHMSRFVEALNSHGPCCMWTTSATSSCSSRNGSIRSARTWISNSRSFSRSRRRSPARSD